MLTIEMINRLHDLQETQYLGIAFRFHENGDYFTRNEVLKWADEVRVRMNRWRDFLRNSS